MLAHKKFTAAASACALALGLAACSGGGGGSKGPTTDEQSADIEALVEAAESAVGTVITTASAGAVAPALIDAAVAAVAAATAALTNANGLSDAERSAFDTAISVIERSLTEERRKAMAAEVQRLSAAIAGRRIIGVSAALAHGEAPSMSGTVPGNRPASVAGLQTAVDGGTRSVDGWQGGTYRAAADGVADTIVLYTNIETLGTRPFSGDDGKYSAASGLDTDGNLPIVTTTDTTLIASAAFPSGPGIVSHESDADGAVRIVGSFDGASGQYVCTPAMGGACRSSIRHGGGYSLTGGSWKFVPAAGAEVTDPDAEYQYFGWWLRQTGDASAIATFHAGAGSASDEFRDLPALQGTATYRGPAVGKFAIEPRIGEAAGGDFAAVVTLEVDFGDAADLGTVDGDVEDFTVNGETSAWSVSLGSARIGSDGSIAADGNDTALTVWTIGGNEGAVAGTPPAWSGQLHDVGEHGVPAVATGVFEASYDEVGRMIGAFGTTWQP